MESKPADERLSAGKARSRTISLNAHHQGTQVIIEIRDDGRGIDLNNIREHAVHNGLDQARRLTRPLPIRTS